VSAFLQPVEAPLARELRMNSSEAPSLHTTDTAPFCLVAVAILTLANEQADERGPGLEPDDVSDLLAKLEASVAQRRSVAANSGTASAPLRIKTKTGTTTVRVPTKKAPTKALAAKGGSGARTAKDAKNATGKKRSHG